MDKELWALKKLSDGTLVDSWWSKKEAYQAIVRMYGIPHNGPFIDMFLKSKGLQLVQVQ